MKTSGLFVLVAMIVILINGCCLPMSDGDSQRQKKPSTNVKQQTSDKSLTEEERLVRNSKNSALWKTVRNMWKAEDPSVGRVHIIYNPLGSSAERAAAARVVFDLRPQDLDVSGYQLNWNTKSGGKAYAEDASFGDWKLLHGTALIGEELDEALPESHKDSVEKR